MSLTQIKTSNIDDTGSGLNFRNRIINGDMRIDQRNAGAAVTSGFPVDRFTMTNTTDGTFSAQLAANAPSGFTSSLKITITGADTSVTTAQYLAIRQKIEGFNISDFGLGTASAKTFTVSFWVRSSLTGVFGGSATNSAADRAYPFTYTISVADTWEQKTVTIAGDTTGTWLTTNGIGLQLFFGLGAGPDRSGTAGVWNSNNNTSATGATSVVGTSGATFYITGVQLEEGNAATAFERRPYGTELSLCQRYFLLISSGTNKPIGLGAMYTATFLASVVSFPVTMRTNPTVYQVTGTDHFIFFRNSNSDPFDSFTLNTTNPYGFEIINNTQISGVAGHSGFIRGNNAATILAAQAEL
jgi:hypothetical protein